MKFLILATLVAITSAWVPGARDVCNPINVIGGSNLLPHEMYCQMYYTCDLEGNQTPLFCPGRLLFAYGPNIATCVPSETTQGGYSTLQCPKWSCSSQVDIGRRYPDTCCGKYWECTAVNQFSERVCQAGTTYDSVNELCVVNGVCADSGFCIDNILPSNNNDCVHSATSDPCFYRTQGWPDDRRCPVGTSFDITTCGCNQFNQGCTASGISAEVLIQNKSPDVQCRASGRMDFSTNNLNVISDKLGQNVDHYFYTPTSGFTVNGIEGVFDQTLNTQPFIYDYYYNDNTLYAPLAITMMVRFDVLNPTLNGVYNLLENRWTTDLSNTHCNPVTLSFSARYLGINLGLREWEFTIAARGQNLIDSVGTAVINGNAQDFFRIVFTFGTTNLNAIGIGGSVSNRGTLGQIQTGNTANFITDNRSMGSALMPNKCGFAIGRGLSGVVREFNVYEGCSNFAQLG